MAKKLLHVKCVFKMTYFVSCLTQNFDWVLLRRKTKHVHEDVRSGVMLVIILMCVAWNS